VVTARSCCVADCYYCEPGFGETVLQTPAGVEAWRVRCVVCFAQGPVCATAEEATRKWNSVKHRLVEKK